jgi:hypothetical protein
MSRAMTSDKKAKEYAKRYGYQLRRIPHSTANPNGYIRVTTPDGRELRASGWIDAKDTVMFDRLSGKTPKAGRS